MLWQGFPEKQNTERNERTYKNDYFLEPLTSWRGTAQTYRILTFVMGLFGMDSVLPTERSILDPCYEIWE
jgi:hypothetical protein